MIILITKIVNFTDSKLKFNDVYQSNPFTVAVYRVNQHILLKSFL